MKIQAVFELDIPEIQEDYPHHFEEVRMNLLVDRLTSFIRRVADDHTTTDTESRVVEFRIATKLIEVFGGRLISDLLRERLKREDDDFCPGG